METKTQTTLGELRIGDAFVFANRYPKDLTIWRVTARADRKGRVAVNQPHSSQKGKMIHMYDELKRASVRVVFIRHTVPVHGEECLLDDLVEGDCFKMPGDTVNIHILVRHGHQFSDVRRTDCAASFKGGRMAKVIYHKPFEDENI